MPLVPAIAYAHAKFWELDDEGDDPSVRTAELVSVLAEGGYGGVVASERGGGRAVVDPLGAAVTIVIILVVGALLMSLGRAGLRSHSTSTG